MEPGKTDERAGGTLSAAGKSERGDTGEWFHSGGGSARRAFAAREWIWAQAHSRDAPEVDGHSFTSGRAHGFCVAPGAFCEKQLHHFARIGIQSIIDDPTLKAIEARAPRETSTEKIRRVADELMGKHRSIEPPQPDARTALQVGLGPVEN